MRREDGKGIVNVCACERERERKREREEESDWSGEKEGSSGAHDNVCERVLARRRG